jgi:hypothetical protein
VEDGFASVMVASSVVIFVGHVRFAGASLISAHAFSLLVKNGLFLFDCSSRFLNLSCSFLLLVEVIGSF